MQSDKGDELKRCLQACVHRPGSKCWYNTDVPPLPYLPQPSKPDMFFLFNTISIPIYNSPQERQPMHVCILYTSSLLPSIIHHSNLPSRIISCPTVDSFPLPLLMLRIQRANNINMSLPSLPSLSPYTLLNH
jgi:hypothetical protein